MTAGVRWVACSRDASYAASQYRHLIRPGQLTTVCGHTASHLEVWRGNTAKPQCPTCLRVWNGEELAATVEAVTADLPAPEPEASPDWHARYKGYAYRQTVKTRNTMAAELARDVTRGHKTPAELERQAARLASYTELIDTLAALKGMLK